MSVSGTLSDGSTVKTLDLLPATSPNGRGYTNALKDQGIVIKNVLGSASLGSTTLANSSVVTYLDNPIIGTATVGYGGTGSSTSDMPTTGTASYKGGFTGMAPTFSSSGLVGDANLTANFGTGAVSGTVTNIKTDTGSANANFGLSFNGTIAGSGFSGTTALTSVNGSTVRTNSSGLTGGFYGSGAAEATGAVLANGAVNNVTTQVIGGFGTKKQ